MDYQKKTGNEIRDVELGSTEDGKLEITMMDNKGKVLDKYTIDRKTAEGTNSAGEPVILPQTGNNSIKNAVIILMALLMIGIGLIAVVVSGVRRRHREE
jgi:hypothetical protein